MSIEHSIAAAAKLRVWSNERRIAAPVFKRPANLPACLGALPTFFPCLAVTRRHSHKAQLKRSQAPQAHKHNVKEHTVVPRTQAQCKGAHRGTTHRVRTAPSVDFQTSCRLALGTRPAPIGPPDVNPPSRNSDPLWETTWCFRRPHQPASPLREMTDHRSIGMAVSRPSCWRTVTKTRARKSNPAQLLGPP